MTSKKERKFIKKQLKNRIRAYQIPDFSVKRYKFLYKVLFVGLIFNFFVISCNVKNNYYKSSIDLPFVILINIIHFCAAYYFYLLSLTPPKKKKENIDHWIFSVGLRKRICKFIASVCILVISFYIFSNLSLNKAGSSFLTFLGATCYFLYNSLILYIIFRPAIILNSFITGVGTGLRILSFSIIIFGIRGILIFYFIDSFLLQLIILILLGLIARILFELDFHYLLNSGKGLDYIQLKVIKVVKPLNLVSSIRKYSEKIRDKKKALKLIYGLRKNNEYGVMEEFANLIGQEKRSNFKWVIGFVSVFILYIFSSIGEGVIQDFFNAEIKPILCESFRIFCS